MFSTTTDRPASTIAAVLRETNAPLSLEEVALPDVLPHGAVLVRVLASTLCGSDTELWTGAMGYPDMLPIVLGHEIVGEIVHIEGARRDAQGGQLSPGDRIGWSEEVCGHCYACTILRQPVACTSRKYGFRQRADQSPFVIGGLSQYCYVGPAAQILPIPHVLPTPLAAAAGCALKTVMGAFEKVGGVAPGETVAVQGAGALGLFAAAVARTSGAGEVCVIGGPETRLDVARRFGASSVLSLSSTSAERRSEYLELTDGRGADIVLDLAGAPGVIQEGVGLAAQDGRYAIVGTTTDAPQAVSFGAVMRKQLRLIGSVNGDARDHLRALRYLAAQVGTFPWNDLFEPAVGLDRATEALAAVAEQTAVKPVIDPWG